MTESSPSYTPESACSVTAPPEADHGVVVLTLLHAASGHVFRCEMSDFDAVSVTLEPEGMTPWPDGDVRGVVAEAARAHAESQRDAFEALFRQAATQRGELGS